MQIGSELYVYHEKQDAALCGVHCLNSLLQGDYFTEVDLMQIARELDEQERKVMMEYGAETKEFLTFMAEDSGNVADDGNYSIQVLAKALEVWGITVIPITNPECTASRKNPLLEQAFICNLASHWLTIRKIGEVWYNLNSLKSEPEFLSSFYLSAFLDTLMHKGYTVFCVRGKLPNVLPDPSLIASGRWKKVKRASSNPTRSHSKTEEEQLEEALAESELQEAIRMSLQQKSPIHNPISVQVPSSPSQNNLEEDQELQKALELSKQIPKEIPEEPASDHPNTTTISFRLLDSSKLERRFLKENRVEHLYNFLESKGISNVLLCTSIPKRVLQDLSKTLEEEALFPRVVLFVQKGQ